MFKAPSVIIEKLNARYWENPATLRLLLKNQLEFPIVVIIAKPSAKIALDNLHVFAEYIKQWRVLADKISLKGDVEVCFETKNYRDLGAQIIPNRLVIFNFQGLVSLLGKQDQVNELQGLFRFWADVFNPHETKIKPFFDFLVDNLVQIRNSNPTTVKLMSELLLQLTKGMGQGGYLRALPLKKVDTKFLEIHLPLIEQLATILIDEEIVKQGLLTWLDVVLKPRHWLLVLPLCHASKIRMGGVPLLRLPSDYLQNNKLPVDNLIIVENEQSALSLPIVKNTMAIAGAGKNTAWLAATFFKEQKLGYWGDIDSEGFTILSDARKKQPHLQSIMMDKETVELFKDRMVNEPFSIFKEPSHLSYEELELFRELRRGDIGLNRLEQERISNDYIIQKVELWQK